MSPGAACQAASIQKGLPLSFLTCKGVPLDQVLACLALTKTYTSVKDQCRALLKFMSEMEIYSVNMH